MIIEKGHVELHKGEGPIITLPCKKPNNQMVVSFLLKESTFIEESPAINSEDAGKQFWRHCSSNPDKYRVEYILVSVSSDVTTVGGVTKKTNVETRTIWTDDGGADVPDFLDGINLKWFHGVDHKNILEAWEC